MYMYMSTTLYLYPVMNNYMYKHNKYKYVFEQEYL